MTTPDAELLTILHTTRLAVQQFACPPQSARRNVQLGNLSRAVDHLERGIEHMDELVGAGHFTEVQGDEIRAVHKLLRAGMASDPGFIHPPDSSPREFLYGHALETSDWDELRQTARTCFHNFAGDGSVLIAISAK